MQGRLLLDTPEKVARAAKMGISDPNKVYTIEEMAKGDVLFAATGVTDGNMLAGVKFGRNFITTDTIVLRSSSRTVRSIKARHQDLEKFGA
jgi:fructose-1,6-bisphosphatase II / sedoheptulose-1,7-bisphosphatase